MPVRDAMPAACMTTMPAPQRAIPTGFRLETSPRSLLVTSRFEPWPNPSASPPLIASTTANSGVVTLVMTAIARMATTPTAARATSKPTRMRLVLRAKRTARASDATVNTIDPMEIARANPSPTARSFRMPCGAATRDLAIVPDTDTPPKPGARGSLRPLTKSGDADSLERLRRGVGQSRRACTAIRTSGAGTRRRSPTTPRTGGRSGSS